MRMPCDHDLRIWVDAQTYLALHHLAADDDRSLSEYCRHVLIQHLRQVSAHIVRLHSGEVVRRGTVNNDCGIAGLCRPRATCRPKTPAD